MAGHLGVLCISRNDLGGRSMRFSSLRSCGAISIDQGHGREETPAVQKALVKNPSKILESELLLTFQQIDLSPS